jgi:hypothetical protein
MAGELGLDRSARASARARIETHVGARRRRGDDGSARASARARIETTVSSGAPIAWRRSARED